jgi:hypothetical protein
MFLTPTENFYFDLNSETTAQLLPANSVNMYYLPLSNQDPVDLIMSATRCIFSVSKPDQDIYLVLKVEKVLQVT